MASELDTQSEYEAFLQALTTRIEHAQVRAALAVNHELVLLYWQIGRDILARQQQQGWGAKVIDQLSRDLRRAFPDLKGFSRRNLLYMRAFAEAWPDESIVQQVAAQIPWFHNCVLLDKLDDTSTRLWYAQYAIKHGWSRDVLVHQIEGYYDAKRRSRTTSPPFNPAPGLRLHPGRRLLCHNLRPTPRLSAWRHPRRAHAVESMGRDCRRSVASITKAFLRRPRYLCGDAQSPARYSVDRATRQ